MFPDDSESRAAQKPPLLGSVSPGPFYSGTPRASVGPTPHRSSLLRHTFTPGPPGTTTSPHSTFSIVIGSSPPKKLVSPIYGSHPKTIKKRRRPFKNPEATPPSQSLPKKKGRPFKTREAAAAAAARAARAAGASTDQLPKRRGRPFKYPQAADEIVQIVPPEPKFVPFICEWKDCPAELHNLDTLQAHLYTVHLKKQRSDGPLVCLWKKCSQEHKVVNAETGTSTFIEKGVEFKTKEEWRNHVKVAHLDPIAWYQGDGPQTALSFTEKPKPAVSYSWHSGGDSGQATPSVKNQPEEGGRARDNNAARFLKKEEGLYVVLVPIENPEAYMKTDYGDDNDDGGDGAGMGGS